MPRLSEIMVFEIRGGQISMYFRSKLGISLGTYLSDHLDLILTSFWSHFGDLGEHFSDLAGSWEQVGILSPILDLQGAPKGRGEATARVVQNPVGPIRDILIKDQGSWIKDQGSKIKMKTKI